MFRKSHILYILFIINIIFSNQTNYYSIEHCLSSYWRLNPSLANPFDDKDLFYYTVSSYKTDCILIFYLIYI